MNNLPVQIKYNEVQIVTQLLTIFSDIMKTKIEEFGYYLIDRNIMTLENLIYMSYDLKTVNLIVTTMGYTTNFGFYFNKFR
jgi:hypothetical protein